ESESEEDGIDEGDDDVEDDHEHEPEPEIEAPIQTEPAVKKTPQAPVANKETERQLSKKELKKKELAELDAVLAELGMSKTNDQDGTQETVEEKKPEELNGNAEKKENPPVESRSAKKKKKKDKTAKEAKDQDQPNGSGATNGLPDEAAGADQGEEDTSTVDVKDRLKKVVSMRKKKSNKEMDAAARAAAIEAAARSARLAAAKKKEKNHYNQQPVR
ncbi:nuclear ubiquitous casein and cyclin-dependent kinase substrate 1-like, partial [Thalictrum thalictroides]